MKHLTIRHATPHDLQAVTDMEALCFPPAEAATLDTMKGRLEVYPQHFWLLYDGERLIGYANGFVSNREVITDEMFAAPTLHNPHGDWQMIFGLGTHPDLRRRGYASYLMGEIAKEAKAQGRRGLVLTCKQEKRHFYESLGFVCVGVSASVHGGALWYDMRKSFEE